MAARSIAWCFHPPDSATPRLRAPAFAKIPALVPMTRHSLEDRVQWVVARFQKNKVSRPKRKQS